MLIPILACECSHDGGGSGTGVCGSGRGALTDCQCLR